MNNTNIIIDKDMTIIGQSKECTVINGTGSSQIFRIEITGLNVTIQNLTITDVNATYTNAAIYNYRSNLTVINSIFCNNAEGAIYNCFGTLNVSNCTFTNNGNDGINYGGAIYNNCWNGGSLTVINSTFDNNTALYGGAIYNSGNSLSISHSNFSNNTGSAGGAIYNYGISAVSDCYFTDNDAYTGGGIYNAGTFTLINSIFNKNEVFSYSAGDYLNGGAIYNNGTFTLINSTFINNRANNYGGAIYSNGTFTLTNSTFDGNSADTGGAIYNYGERIKGNYGIFISTNCTFNNNDAITGGAIYNIGTFTLTDSMINNNDAITGGAIYNDYGGVLTVTNGTFNNNSEGAITNGGSLDVQNSSFTGNTADYGGTINNGNGLTVNNCTFNKNKAKDGGAIWSASCSHLYLISNSTFTGNIATNYGGAIYVESNDWRVDPVISNSTFIDNTAFGGGAIYTEAVLAITNSTFNGNSVTNWGGAIYNINNLTATNNTFSNNKAFNGGAICNGGELTLNNSTLNNNNAAGYGGVIYNYFDDYFTRPCNSEVHFNRIVGNTATFLGSAIYNDDGLGLVNATLNWWGSNNDPSDNIYGANVTVTPWLVLNITSNPNTIFGGGNSVIIVDLQHDSNGVFHDPANGHIPDGMPLTFTLGGLDTLTTVLLNGQAQSLFTANSLGTTDISTAIDDQIVHTFVTVIPPAVAAVDPANNTKTNSTSKIITITFNEAIKAGSAYDGISVTGPSEAVSITKRINGNVLTITPASGYINGSYTINIPVDAVTDLAGNGLETAFISSFTVDTLSPAVTATPNKGVSNSTISVNLLSESDATIYYRINNGSWYTLTGSGKVLISNMETNKLEFYAVDAAGNPSAHTTYSYTIDKTKPTVTSNCPSGTYNTRTITLSAKDNLDPNPVIYYSVNNGVTWNHQSKTVILDINQGKTVLKFYAKDAAGNSCAVQTATYMIDTTAPKATSTYPKSGAKGVSRTAIISIKFSENIKASVNWSKIYIKNLRTGKLVPISKSISGNTLKIKMSSKKYAYNWYQVYIPKSAVKDSAGNNLAGVYKFNFKTGKY